LQAELDSAARAVSDAHLRYLRVQRQLAKHDSRQKEIWDREIAAIEELRMEEEAEKQAQEGPTTPAASSTSPPSLAVAAHSPGAFSNFDWNASDFLDPALLGSFGETGAQAAGSSPNS
jgi:hypothetical protein